MILSVVLSLIPFNISCNTFDLSNLDFYFQKQIKLEHIQIGCAYDL